MRCIYCGEEMSEWEKKCPACGMEDVHSKTALRELKRRKAPKFMFRGFLCLLGFLVIVAGFILAYKMIERASVITKYSNVAEQYLQEDDYYNALDSYCAILRDYPKSRVAHDGLVEVFVTMCEDGYIKTGDQGYSIMQKYDVYLDEEDEEKMRDALLPYFE